MMMIDFNKMDEKDIKKYLDETWAKFMVYLKNDTNLVYVLMNTRRNNYEINIRYKCKKCSGVDLNLTGAFNESVYIYSISKAEAVNDAGSNILQYLSSLFGVDLIWDEELTRCTCSNDKAFDKNIIINSRETFKSAVKRYIEIKGKPYGAYYYDGCELTFSYYNEVTKKEVLSSDAFDFWDEDVLLIGKYALMAEYKSILDELGINVPMCSMQDFESDDEYGDDEYDECEEDNEE